jgi:hypothetical protein
MSTSQVTGTKTSAPVSTGESTAPSTTTTETYEGLTQSIVDVSAEPKSVTGDQGSIENHSLRDLIAADEYIRKTKASKKANRMAMIKGMFIKMNPPGTRG